MLLLMLDFLWIIFDIIWFFLKIIWRILEEIWYWHWHIRRTYQTSLYNFNAYHGFKVWKKKLLKIACKIEFYNTVKFTYSQHFKFLRLFITIIEKTTSNIWYYSWWFGWCWLTYYLYYHEGVRDLGPSYDYYDYNPWGELGLWWTIGYLLFFIWMLWTWVANSVFIISIYLILNKFFLVRLTWYYWHTIIIRAFFDISFINAFNIVNQIYAIFFFYYTNYFELLNFSITYYYTNLSNDVGNTVLYSSTFILATKLKKSLLWFPWSSYFSIITCIFISYLLTFTNIYRTENVYYIILYTLFFIMLITSLLIILDLDIFAGLLLLIESVVVLMLFFLVIYLSPNSLVTTKVHRWKLYGLFFIFIFLVSLISTLDLGESYFYLFSITTVFLDDFYEALSELSINDLTGIFAVLYLTNSLLIIIIGLALLISSIICVILVSFFTKVRNFDLKSFLNLFKIVKTCYSLIFLRKQNLSKQARNTASSKFFLKKIFDSKIHSEYRQKKEIFEEKKKDEQKKMQEEAIKEKLKKESTVN